MLATLRLDPPPSLAATATGGAAVELQWGASPSAASRDVQYAVLRRPAGASAYEEVGRTSALIFTDAAPQGSFEYVVRTVVSSFSSGDSPIATATNGP